MPKREWLLKRNCSLSPRQLACAYALPCLVSICIAALFIRHGAWHMLFFSMLEAVALACAFCFHARHVSDHEHLALIGDCLLVERVCGGAVRQMRLDLRWTRVVPPRCASDLIQLQANGMRVEIGRFISDAKRQEVAQDLRRELAAQGSAT